jgi:hypothetical protein
MEKNQIHRLLEKYFEGNTTLDEEKSLHGFFAEEGVDKYPEWLPLKKQFELFRAGKELSFDTAHLDSGLFRLIEEYEIQQTPPAGRRNLVRFMIAACITIAVVLSGIFIFRSQNRQIRDTYSDPQLAYAETQKALLFVSQKMNQGMKPLNHITKINSGTEQLKNLEKMDKSLGMLNLVSFINQSSNLKK